MKAFPCGAVPDEWTIRDVVEAVLAAADSVPLAPKVEWTGEADEPVRESVRWFAAHMERKLRKHSDWDEAGDSWKECGNQWLMDRLEVERRELIEAINEWLRGDIHNSKRILAVISECADISNFAMMIADNARGYLPPLPVRIPTPGEKGGR